MAKTWKPGKAGLTAALMAYQAARVLGSGEFKHGAHQAGLDIAARVYLMYSKTLTDAHRFSEGNLKWARTEIIRHGIIAGIIKLELEVKSDA